LSAEDSGRYNSGAADKILFIRVHLSRRSRRLASSSYVERIRNSLELLVGAKADSWLVGAHEYQR